MAHRVYKFELHPSDRPIIDMPRGARLLHVGIQGASAFVWALVEVGAPAVTRRFVLCGTGHDMPHPDAPHVGTFFMGPLVWHLFDLGVRGES